MTQKEFETLTGTEVTEENFAVIEKVYLSADDIDEADFCDMWKKASKESRCFMVGMAGKMASERNSTKKTMDVTSRLIDSTTDAIVKSVWKAKDAKLRDACIKVIGGKRYLRSLVGSNYNLRDEDKKLLLDVLI